MTKLTDLNDFLMETMVSLKNGEMKSETAISITKVATIMVQGFKVQADVLKSLPKEMIKQASEQTISNITGISLTDNIEMDRTMKAIEEKKKETYKKTN